MSYPETTRTRPAAFDSKRLEVLAVAARVFSAEGYDRATMRRIAAEARASLAGIYHCPHHPEDGCDCRKPEPGMLHQAGRELGFDPAQAVVIGDKACDIDLGRAVGAKTILVRTGYGAKEEADSRADFVADDLDQAAGIILSKLDRS